MPDAAARDEVLGRVAAAGIAVEDDGLVRDPSGNALRLETA
jgi:hypothetical protein